jgi:hypothetical protein
MNTGLPSIGEVSAAAPARPAARASWARLGAYALAAVLLAAVSMAYFNPHLMLDLANRVWACF